MRQFDAWLRADPTFRDELHESPSRAVERRGISIVPEDVRPLWDPSACGETANLGSYIEEGKRRRAQARQAMRASEPELEPLRIWWRRQRERARNQLGPRAAASIVHAPAAIELSRGCSVGCWFCGVAAERLVGHFLHTAENAALFRGVLKVIRSFWGSTAAAEAFCYWATDPLDNPDYEAFLGDFVSVLGRTPQTTTAQALKHPDRVREISRLDQANRGGGVRLSVLSLGMLRKIYQIYSLEEMEHLGCLPLNRESMSQKAVAGRLYGSEPTELAVSTDNVRDTIACVSGLLINMLERSVKLITPTNATDRWPLGYWVIEAAEFESAAHLHEIVAGMVDRNMPPAIAIDDPVRLLPGTRIERRNESCTIEAPKRSFKLRNVHLAECLASHTRTAGEIALWMRDQAGTPFFETFRALNELRAYGLFDEEPPLPPPVPQWNSTEPEPLAAPY